MADNEMQQCWTIRLTWSDGHGGHYERGRNSLWPVGTSPMQVLEDVASDPGNGCDLTICSSIEISRVGEPVKL